MRSSYARHPSRLDYEDRGFYNALRIGRGQSCDLAGRSSTKGATMTIATNATPPQEKTSHLADQPQARVGLALVRLTIGAMFVWVFFENLGKGLYTPAGYAGLINFYIKQGRAPSAWKAVMALAASHGPMAGPLQWLPRISPGCLLVAGLLKRTGALVACGVPASPRLL